MSEIITLQQSKQLLRTTGMPGYEPEPERESLEEPESSERVSSDASTDSETPETSSSQDIVNSEESEVTEPQNEEEEESHEREDDPEFNRLRKQQTEAEKQRREFQSAHDSMKSENQQLRQALQGFYQEFNDFKTKASTTPSESTELEIDDDALIDGKRLKAILAKQVKSSPTTTEKPAVDPSLHWVNTQPDFSEIQRYIQEEKLQQDSYLAQLPTNAAGLYAAVKEHKTRKELVAKTKKIQQLEAKVKELQGGSTKGKGLPSETSGYRPRVSKTNPKMGVMESQITSFFKKKGIPL